MNGIKMSDCRFYVNKEERTIVCVIPNTNDMFLDFIDMHMDFPNLEITPWGKLRKHTLNMPYSFMGKAVCAPEDEWDEEVGRMIAFSKAKDKCYKSFFKRANTYVQTLDRRLGDMIETFNNFGLKLETKREALEKEIESKTKKEGDA